MCDTITVHISLSGVMGMILNKYKHLLILCTWILLSQSTKAQVPCGGYEVTAIIQAPECPPFGYPPTFVWGLNEQGWMVGSTNSCVIGPGVAWIWTPNDGLMTIPMPVGTSQSTAIDIYSAQIVGNHFVSGDEFGAIAYLYDLSTNEFTDLGTLPGGDWSQAHAINSKGEIVGFWGNTVMGPSPLAFIWRDGEMININPDLGTLKSEAKHISDSGLVTGWMGTAPGTDARAFIWDEGTVTELPPIPGGFTSIAAAISNDSTVVGWGFREEGNPSDTVTRAFLWQDGDMLDIGTLPDHLLSAALGMRVSPFEIVGVSWDVPGNPAVSHAVIWNKEGLQNLNDLVNGNNNLILTSATAINQAGQISARAIDQFNNTVAVLLTPVESPLGDLDNDCVVGVSDLILLLNSWGTCKTCDICLADLNQDCKVSTYDLLLLLSNWG